MNEFLSYYNKLSANDKHKYSPVLRDVYYNLACIYSMLNYKENAIKYLQMSFESGYKNYVNLGEDSQLDNIRNEVGFWSILNKIKGMADYLSILRRAHKYDFLDHRPIPKFTYQLSNNENLINLRRAFKLNKIAGKGNDILKILNLMHWIHNLIPHNGILENPIIKNALSMIRECKRNKRGLNCRGLAIILNECYLAIGIKSRIVTCLPKDILNNDPDCHVINMVYAPSLNKWLWIDPSFNAYVMNEKGELLSIEEVRERIIKNKPMILNPDANWNNKRQQTKDYYLFHYMAKNLYILESPINNEYNMETDVKGKVLDYIQLLPLDYPKQTPNITEIEYEKTETICRIYKTNNPKIFWQAPN